MKYLKSYKIFESLNELDTLSDICDELRDEGYSVDIGQPYKTSSHLFVSRDRFKNIGDKKQNVIVVEVNVRVPVFPGVSVDTDYTLNYFSFVKVKESFDRMDSYMKSEGYKSELELCRQKMGGVTWEKFSGKNTDKHKSYRINFFKNEAPKL